MKMTVFWKDAPRSLVEFCLRFEMCLLTPSP
jgi:hypothetical protein